MTTKTGLAFSGGGTRSAALCSGVLRRLLQKRVLIDYLSSVSGGGCTAASYMYWKYRNGKVDDPAWHKEYFDNLRKYANPLCDCFSPIRGFLDGVCVVLFMLFFTVGISLLRAFSFIIPVTYIVDYLFGDILRDQFNCNETSALSTNMSTSLEGDVGLLEDFTDTKLCLPKFGRNMEVMFLVTFSWLAAFVISFYLSTVIRRRTPKYMLKFLYQLSGFGFAMIFLPWFLELYRGFTPTWAKYFLVVAVLVTALFFPALRDRAFFVLFILIFAYCVKWTVFQTPLAGVQYTDRLYWNLVWTSAVVLWLHPYLGALQMYGPNYYLEWRLRRAYFFSGRCIDTAGQNNHVMFGDLADVQPEYKCNLTVNQWRKTNSESEKNYEALILSPTNIERLDRKKNEVEFDSEDFIKPSDIRLSNAMTTSIAVLSFDVGKLENNDKSYREIRVAMGLGVGNNLVAQKGLHKACNTWTVTLVMQVVFGFVTISIPVALYYEVLVNWDFWEKILMALICSAFLILGFIAVMPTGVGKSKKSRFGRVIRWCIIHILHIRLIRTFLGIVDVGSTPPPILSLTDGGHTENLGLLPLFKLRLSRIVVVNGGTPSRGGNYATDLLEALRQAREKLRCSFVGINGRDISEDIRDHFVETEKGKQPRSYRFKVQYYEKEGYESKLVGEGEVLMLMPRHPEDGNREFQDYKWSDFDGDVKLELDELVWGPGPSLTSYEVDRLSGCCCECCHMKPFNFILNALMSGFPFHSTVNQMLTSSQYTAYHREGYLACVEAQADKFLGKFTNQMEVITNQPLGSRSTVRTATPTIINVMGSTEYLLQDLTTK